MRLSKSIKGLLLMLAAWTIMFIIASVVFSRVAANGSAPLSPLPEKSGPYFVMADLSRSFDDCQGSPMPDDKGGGCIGGGLHRAM